MKIVFAFLLSSLFTIPLIAQNFGSQEPFHLINIGNGAAAVGMGGAYVAIAEDLSALAWNPAGLSGQSGLRIQFDSLYTTGTEKFQVTTNLSGTSQHDFSVGGFQPQSFAMTYQLQRGDVVFGPAFGWGRSTLSLHNYEMDTPATGHFLEPIFRSEGDYSYRDNRTYDRGGEDTYSFGFSIKMPNHLSAGAVWNVLGGESTQNLTTNRSADGTYFFRPPDQDPVFAPFQSSLNINRNLNEKFSGNYFNVGILYEPNMKVSVGGSVRFGYTRKIEYSEVGTWDLEFSGVTSISEHRISESGRGNFESRIPAEFSGGVAIRPNPRLRIASSLTFGDYAPAQDVNFFPTQSGSTTFQSHLLQWRNGLEYHARDYLTLRAGWVLDDQPYSKQYYPVNEPDDAPFYGFTVGSGWSFNKIGFDIAFLHEQGRALFGRRLGGISDHDVEFSDGRVSHNRIFFTLKFQSLTL